MEFDVLVDVKGLCCAEPISRMKKEFQKMKSGQIAKVVADKVSLAGDMVSFCRMTKHELVKNEEHSGIFSFWIKIR